jgi:hypothetical protein
MRTILALLLSAPLAIAQGDVVVATVKSGEVAVTVGGKPFTTLVAQKDGLAKPYLYPILAPNGAAVTRDWPMKSGTANETKDHVHQKSAWFCHGDVIPEGVELKVKSSDRRVAGVDFWSESKGHGTIETTAFRKTTKRNMIGLDLDWKAPEGLTIMKEVRMYEFSVVAGGRLIRCSSTLSAIDFPLTLGDTKEGSFGIRVHDSLRMTLKGGDGMLTNSQGKSGMKDVWGLPADWCDYSGTVDDKKVGVAVFAHTGNPVPSLWHARDYGLLAANPFGRKVAGFPAAKDKTDLYRIEKGKSATFRFAIFAHDGDVKAGKVAEAFDAYVNGRN